MERRYRTFFLYVEETPLLDMHPAVKLLALLTINLVAWLLEAPIPLLILLALLISSYVLLRVPLSRIRRFLLYALLVSQAVVVSYALGSRIPGHVVYAVLPWGAYISDMTLLYMATMIMRFASMLVGSTLLLSAMRDVDVIYGLLSFKVPYTAAFAFNLAFRFSSLFLDDYKMIRDAMILRGAKLDEGGILQRARNYSRMGIPLTVIALRRMNELSYVLEIKGLGFKGRRTHLHEFRWSARDICAVLLLLGSLAAVAALRLATDLLSFPGWPLA